MPYVVNWFGVTDDSTQVLTVERNPGATDFAQNGIYLSADYELVCTFDPVDVSDNYARGWAISIAGTLRVLQADGGEPSGAVRNGGFLTSITGQLCVTSDAVDHYIAGVPVNVYGAVCIVGGTPPGPCDTPTTIFSLPADITVSGTGTTTQLELNSKAYQPFSFSTGGIVTDLHWTGGTSPGPEPFDITAWLIEFWNDNAGVPGTLNQTAVFSPALANKTAIGLIQGGSLHGYTFSVDVLPWFLADPGVTYWVSLQPSLQLPEQFFWISSTTPGNSFLDFDGTPIPSAFALSLDITGCDGTITVNTRITGDGDTRITGNGDTRITG